MVLGAVRVPVFELLVAPGPLSVHFQGFAAVNPLGKATFYAFGPPKRGAGLRNPRVNPKIRKTHKKVARNLLVPSAAFPVWQLLAQTVACPFACFWIAYSIVRRALKFVFQVKTDCRELWEFSIPDERDRGYRCPHQLLVHFCGRLASPKIISFSQIHHLIFALMSAQGLVSYLCNRCLSQAVQAVSHGWIITAVQI